MDIDIDYICDSLEGGYTLEDVCAQNCIDKDEVLTYLESNKLLKYKVDRAISVAYLRDRQFFLDNVTDKNFDAKAYLVYMANRWGWSNNPAKLNKRYRNESELRTAILDGDIDANTGMAITKALEALSAIEAREKLEPLIRQLEELRDDYGRNN